MKPDGAGIRRLVDIEQVKPALARLATLLEDDDDLIGYLRALTHFALLEVPSCVGVSITVIAEDVPYTVSATDLCAQTLDAVQYVDGGPCVDTAVSGSATEVADVFDEQRWHAYAVSSAAAGVRSSLSLPVLFHGNTVGALNLYGGTREAFDDRAHMLAELVSGHAALAIRNADLPMRTADDAAALDRVLEAQPDSVVEQAVGVLVQQKGLTPEEARRQLRHAAARAGIEPASLAQSIVELNES